MNAADILIGMGGGLLICVVVFIIGLVHEIWRSTND